MRVTGARSARSATAVAVAGVLGIAAAGCGGGARAGGDPTRLVVWQMGAGSAAQTRFLAGVAAEFHRRHPHTRVQVQYVPWQQATQKFQTAIASGSGPDVTEVGNTDVRSWADQGAFADITGPLRRWPPGRRLDPAALANDTVGGRTYAVPWYGGVRAVWYRKDWFSELGIRPPATWPALVAAARRIQQAKGVPGIAAPSDFTNGILSFIWANGGDVAVRRNGRWTGTLSEPPARAAVEFYAGLVTTEKVAPAKYVGRDELQGPQQDFALGRLGMYMDGSWALPQLEAINKRGAADWGVFPIPGPDGGMAPVFSGGSDLAVWADSRHKDAAFDYITVLDDERNAQAFAATLRFLPRFTDLLTGAAYERDPIMRVFARATVAGVRFTPASRGWADYEGAKKVLPNAMREIMQGAPAGEVLRKADEQADSLLNE